MLVRAGPLDPEALQHIRLTAFFAAGYSSTNKPYPPASGGADGSLLLNATEVDRTIENPLQGYRQYLFGIYCQYEDSVSAADIVQVAGSVGTVSCPGGPVYKTVVGRTDNSQAAPKGTLPHAFGPQSSYQALTKLWAEKGFSPRELAALIGAHSVSRSFAQEKYGIPPGGPQDTTPTKWDVAYYGETQNGTAPFPFESDLNLAAPNTESGQAFTEFAHDTEAWNQAFSAAMYKLSVLGINQTEVDSFTDCTSLISAIKPSSSPPEVVPGFSGPGAPQR